MSELNGADSNCFPSSPSAVPIGFPPTVCSQPFIWRRAVASHWSGLEPTTRLVLITLSYFGDKNGLDIFPSQKRVADRCGFSVRTVRNHIKIGMAEGWVKRRPRGQGFYYTLTLPHRIGLLNEFKPGFHEKPLN